MTLSFPSDPINGAVAGDYTYDATKTAWRKNAALPVSVTHSDVAPSNPRVGDQWWKSNEGTLFTYYNDGTSSQWVESTNVVASSDPNPIPAGAMMAWASDVVPANWLLCDGAAVSRSTYASLFASIGTTYGSGDGTTTFNVPNLKGRTIVGKDASQTEFDALAETGGTKTHTLILAEMPAHTHGTVAHSHTFSGTTSGESGHSHTAYGISTPSGSGSGYLGLQTDSNLVWYRGNGTVWSAGGGAGGSIPAINVGGNMSTSTSGSTGHTHTYSGSTSNAAPDTQSVGSGSPHNNLQPYIVLNYIIKFSAGETPGDSQLAIRVGTLETGVRSVAVGGTGASSLTSGGYLKGSGTSAITSQVGIPAGDITSGSLNVLYGGTGASTGSGLVPIVPTSTTGTGGTVSVNTNGKVTLSGAGQWQLNGVFSDQYTNYRIILRGASDADRGFGWRFTQGGTVNSNAFYHWSMFWNGGSGMGTNAAQSATYVGYSLGHRYMAMSMDVFSPKVTGHTHHMIAEYSGLNSATNGAERHTVSGILRDVNYSADGIFGFVSAGSFSGTIQVFGYRD